MIIQIGAETNKAKALAKALGEEIVSVNAQSRASAPLKQLGPKDILVADLNNDLQDSDKELLRSAVADGATLVLENTSPDSMAEYAVIGIKATTVVIKSADGGRNQQIIIDSPGQQIQYDGHQEELPVEQRKSGEAVPVALRNAALARGISLEEKGLIEPPASITEPIERSKGVPPTLELSEEEKTRRLALWLKDDSFQQSLERSQLSEDWTQVSGSEAHATIVFSSIRWKPLAKQLGLDQQWADHLPTQIAEYFGSLDVDLYAVVAPRKTKLLKIKSTGTAVAIPNGLSSDTDWNKHYFTVEGQYLLYPGTTNIEPNQTEQINLPAGWRRLELEPRTPNSITKYTSTTGWSVGVKGEAGGGATGPEASITLEASYSSSNTVEREIPDFRVSNKSSSAVCNWTYEYSRYKNNWMELFTSWAFYWDTIESLPQLAKSMLDMDNEVIYEAPANTTNTQPFVFSIQHTVGALWVTSPLDVSVLLQNPNYGPRHKWEGKHRTYWGFSVDMNRVRHPN